MPSPEVVARRRVVCVVTALVGAVLLALSLSTPPGSSRFYPLAAALALTWFVGALLAGPVRIARTRPRAPTTPAVAGLLAGLALAGACVVGTALIGSFAPVHSAVTEVTDIARRGVPALVLPVAVVTGAAEELFFRGAVFDALPRDRAVVGSTAVYALITLATGNLMLVLAAAVLGGVTSQQRRVTGGVLAPVVTHAVWSTCMVLALPPVLELVGP
ncbi:CPBP family intramembrane glutamic endopeptidase [Luteipulveratus halotolerans]|uniref:CAAX prenyl protease 2/Lysostaphin resistance protein A-like domain-containing protein n=1 Tax=Luteipulveratus halotolerans TaxID=1631356 RepID=A0A0L6CG95_9MICO|nr:CPBP family intramembrane glutamic endopeptidase [Luteipulveratus halotolerans]KNX36846.1 hypothetical protein VV01_06300 [Luteipulveratus halotolerans]